MNLYLILVVAVVSHCSYERPHSFEVPANINAVNAVMYQSPTPPAPSPSCEASLDVIFTTDTAKAYAALEAGRRVFKIVRPLNKNSNILMSYVELHRVAETKYHVIEEPKP